MNHIKTRTQNLIYNIVVSSSHTKFIKDSYHLNYQSGTYREDDLVDLIRDTVIFFALTKDELNSIDAGTVARLQKRAWKRISDRPSKMKGDYGELLLFLILEVFYPARKLVTKVRLRSSYGDEVKGYDCAHFSIDGDEICLWLGEAKFHQNYSTALSSVVNSINSHMSDKLIKDELTILEGNNTEINEVDRKVIDDYLNSGISMDEMKFKIPILITYNSDTVMTNSSISKSFLNDLEDELDKKYKTIDGKSFIVKHNIELHFIILPLKTVKNIKDKLELVEAAHK